MIGVNTPGQITATKYDGHTDAAVDNASHGQRQSTRFTFKELISRGTFVDKSLLIREYLADEEGGYVYVTAPRGFGKTVNAQMMKHFFEIQTNDSGHEVRNKSRTSNFRLFEGLKVYREQRSLFDKWFGRQPVVYVDCGPLANVTDYKAMLAGCEEVLRAAYAEHQYLLKPDPDRAWNITDDDRFCFELYVGPGKLDESEIMEGIALLCDILHRRHRVQPVVLLDDFDAYLRKMTFEKVADGEKLLSLFRRMHRVLFECVRDRLSKVFIVGTLNVKRIVLAPHDELFVDKFFLHNHRFGKYYGLSTDALDELVRKQAGDQPKAERLGNRLRSYYGGYRICGQNAQILNPQSVTEYLRNERELGERAPTAYSVGCLTRFGRFLRTPPVTVIFKGLLNRTGVSRSVARLLHYSDKTVSDIEAQFSSGRFSENGTDLILNLMLHFGFLTYSETSVATNRSDSVSLKIPNREVANAIAGIVER